MKLGAFITWIAAISIALAFAIKPQSLHLGVQGADKIMHLGVFMALTLIPVITFDKLRNIALSLAFLIAFGMIIEIIQHYIPTRQAEMMDFIYDGVGIVMGTMIGFALRSTYQSMLPKAYIETYIKG